MIKASFTKRYAGQGDCNIEFDGELVSFKLSNKGWSVITRLMVLINEINASVEAERASFAALSIKRQNNFNQVIEMNRHMIDVCRDRLGLEVDISTMH